MPVGLSPVQTYLPLQPAPAVWQLGSTERTSPTRCFEAALSCTVLARTVVLHVRQQADRIGSQALPSIETRSDSQVSAARRKLRQQNRLKPKETFPACGLYRRSGRLGCLPSTSRGMQPGELGFHRCSSSRLGHKNLQIRSWQTLRCQHPSRPHQDHRSLPFRQTASQAPQQGAALRWPRQPSF